MFEYRRKIYGFECDIYGHLNNANYQHLLEEARSEALEKMGLSLLKLSSEDIHIYLKRIEIDYIKAIPFGGVVSVSTKITELTRVKSVWLQEIFNPNGELATKAVVLGVFSRTNRPQRLSEEYLNIFKKFVV